MSTLLIAVHQAVITLAVITGAGLIKEFVLFYNLMTTFTQKGLSPRVADKVEHCYTGWCVHKNHKLRLFILVMVN